MHSLSILHVDGLMVEGLSDFIANNINLFKKVQKTVEGLLEHYSGEFLVITILPPNPSYDCYPGMQHLHPLHCELSNYFSRQASSPGGGDRQIQ